VTEEVILLIVGYIVSVLLEFIPGFNKWWSDVAHKRALLFGLCLGIPVVVWLLVCVAGLSLPLRGVACTTLGLAALVELGLATFFGTQTGYVTASQYTPNARART